MNNDLLCRTCVRGNSKLININLKYDVDKEEALSVAELMVICLSVKVNLDDTLPKQICSECLFKLTSAYNFKLTSEKSYKWFADNALTIVKEENTKCEDQDEGYCLPVDSKDCLQVEVTVPKCEFNKSDSFTTDHDSTPLFKNNRIAERKEIVSLLSIQQRKVDRSRKSNVKKTKTRCSLQCPLCLKPFKFPHLLHGHLNSHSGVKKYYCSICKKYYKSHLHNKIHKNESRYTCDICFKSFCTKGKVRVHLQIHSSMRKKNFVCKIPDCKKAYLSIQGLTRHQTIHSGAKNYLCHLCSKTFADKAGLLLHMLFHVNEKNFNCRKCGKAFFTASNRNQHEKRHNEKKHPCGQCERWFYSQSHLKRHMVTHTNEMNHECRFCAKKFSRKDNKRRHEFVMHGYSGKREKNIMIERSQCKIDGTKPKNAN